MRLLKELKNRMAFLDKEIAEIKEMRFPEGTIRISNTKTKPFYYRKLPNVPDTYLRKTRDAGMITLLLKKKYFTEVLNAAAKEKEILAEVLKIEEKEVIANLYQKIPAEQRKSIPPAETAVKNRIEAFERLNPAKKEIKPGNYCIKTKSGLFVRSKAEMLIADTLLKHGIPYHYEMPFLIKPTGQILYPDFTVMDPETGEKTIWEHAGMLDKPDYVDIFLRKMELYLMEGIFPGHGMIVTFHTMTPSEIERIVKLFF